MGAFCLELGDASVRGGCSGVVVEYWTRNREVAGSTHTRSTESNLEQVANLLRAQANSASYPQRDGKWVAATATGWRPSVADWGDDVSNCPLTLAMDVHVMRFGTIGSCQSAATSEIDSCKRRYNKCPDFYLYLYRLSLQNIPKFRSSAAIHFFTEGDDSNNHNHVAVYLSLTWRICSQWLPWSRWCYIIVCWRNIPLLYPCLTHTAINLAIANRSRTASQANRIRQYK